jgi:hypothetical protein
VNLFAAEKSGTIHPVFSISYYPVEAGIASALWAGGTMTEREAKSRAVKILAKSIYRDLEAQGFDERQIVALATELISEVTTKMARTEKAQQLA